MRYLRFSTCLMVGLAVAVILLPSGHALAAGEPDIVYWPLIPAVGETVEFADNSAGISIFWAWDFDDGAGGSGPTPTHIFNRAGTYKVKMTTWDSRGHKDDFQQNIVVIEDPQSSAPTAGSTSPRGASMMRSAGLSAFELLFDVNSSKSNRTSYSTVNRTLIAFGRMWRRETYWMWPPPSASSFDLLAMAWSEPSSLE